MSSPQGIDPVLILFVGWCVFVAFLVIAAVVAHSYVTRNLGK